MVPRNAKLILYGTLFARRSHLLYYNRSLAYTRLATRCSSRYYAILCFLLSSLLCCCFIARFTNILHGALFARRSHLVLHRGPFSRPTAWLNLPLPLRATIIINNYKL